MFLSWSPRLGRLAAFSWLLLTFVGSPQQIRAADSSGDALNSLVRAWRNRQDSVHSLDIVAKGTELHPAHDVSSTELTLAGAAPDVKPFALPEASFDVSVRVAVDERGRGRFEYRGQTWSAQTRGYVAKSYVLVFDGSRRTSYIGAGSGEGQQAFPVAGIGKGSLAETVRHVLVEPFLITYRPLEKDLTGISSAELELANEKGVVDGRQCLIVKQGDTTLWVDPGMDFVPLRYSKYSRGRLLRTVDLKFRMKEGEGPLLASWTSSAFGAKHGLLSTVSLHVEERHINETLPDKVFTAQLIDGTWVTEKNVDAVEMYIVRDGGKRRPVLPGEYDGTNYEQLLHSDPPGKRGTSLWWLVLPVTVIAVASGLVILYWRKRRLRAA